MPDGDAHRGWSDVNDHVLGSGAGRVDAGEDHALGLAPRVALSRARLTRRWRVAVLAVLS